MVSAPAESRADEVGSINGAAYDLVFPDGWRGSGPTPGAQITGTVVCRQGVAISALVQIPGRGNLGSRTIVTVQYGPGVTFTWQRPVDNASFTADASSITRTGNRISFRGTALYAAHIHHGRGQFHGWIDLSCPCPPTPTPTATATPTPDLNGHPLKPLMTCITPMGDGSYTAYFGYLNRTSAPITVPFGNENYFSTPPEYRGQPHVFQPGLFERAFSIPFTDTAKWRLVGKQVTASRSSPVCPAE